jgi:hypothetical protein
VLEKLKASYSKTGGGPCREGYPSFTEPLLVIVAILALLAAFVSGSSGALVAAHTDCRFDISLVVPTKERFLILRMCLIAFPAACRAALGPASAATDADAVLPAKCSHHASRILATCAHRSGRASLKISIPRILRFDPNIIFHFR